jgi:hypothetical protein
MSESINEVIDLDSTSNLDSTNDLDSINLSLANKKDKIFNCFVNWARNSSIHGLPSIFSISSPRYKKHLIIKKVWIISVIISLVTCSYFVAFGIKKYFNHEVKTQVRIKPQMPAEFPAVTICNQNMLITNFSQEFVDQVFEKYNIVNNTALNFTSLVEKQKFLIFLMSQNSYELLTLDERNKLGLTIDEMIISCKYNQIPCQKDDFDVIYKSGFGNCFMFNSINAQKRRPVKLYQNKGFSLSGLVLELFVGSSDNFVSLDRNTGITVFIHNESIMPSVQEGILAKTNMHTNFNIYRTYSDKLGSPYSDCINLDTKNENRDPKKSAFIFLTQSDRIYSYREKDCIDLCYTEEVIRKCSCYSKLILPSDLTNYFGDTSIKPCITLEQIACDYDAFQYFFENFKSLKKQKCFCPEECDRVAYEVSVSFANYPIDSYAKILHKKFMERNGQNNNTTKIDHLKEEENLKNFKKNILSLSIYYDLMEYKSITEVAVFSQYDLLSMFGGTLGLFLGFSFFSFFELMNVLIELLYILIF